MCAAGRASALDRREPGLGRPDGLRRPPDPAGRKPPVGPGSDPGIVAVAPVDEVVTALRPGPGVVRDLVGRHPCRRAQLLGRRIHRRRHLCRRQAAQSPASRELAEPRPGLDGELVQRQVIDRHRHRLGELRRPVRHLLALARIDEIEAHPWKDRAGDCEGAPRLGDVVHPPECLQRPVVECLHPHRQPVDPGSAVAPEAPGLDRGRIGLERHLGVGGEFPCRRDRLEHRGHGLGRHQARGAAAEEHRIDRAAPAPAAPPPPPRPPARAPSAPRRSRSARGC